QTVQGSHPPPSAKCLSGHSPPTPCNGPAVCCRFACGGYLLMRLGPAPHGLASLAVREVLKTHSIRGTGSARMPGPWGRGACVLRCRDPPSTPNVSPPLARPHTHPLA